MQSWYHSFIINVPFVRCSEGTNIIIMFSALVAAVKYRSVLHQCVVIFFCSSGIMDCMWLMCKTVPPMRWGRQCCGILHYHWWPASIKPRQFFSRGGYAAWGLSLSLIWKSLWYCVLVQYIVRIWLNTRQSSFMVIRQVVYQPGNIISVLETFVSVYTINK